MKLQKESDTEIKQLINRIKQLEDERARLAAKQRSLDADIIGHLATHPVKGESDKEVRRELNQYARDTLELTRSVAASRSSAALVAKSNPDVCMYIRKGQIGFSALRAMEPYRNIGGMLEASLGKTRRQVEQIVSDMVDPQGGSSVNAAEPDQRPSDRAERRVRLLQTPSRRKSGPKTVAKRARKKRPKPKRRRKR